MRNEITVLYEALEKLRLVKNHVNHEYNIDMFNINESIRRLEHFIEDVRNSEDYKKANEGE